MNVFCGLILLSVLIIETLGYCNQGPRNEQDCKHNQDTNGCSMYNFDFGLLNDDDAYRQLELMNTLKWECESEYIISTNVIQGRKQTYWITWKSIGPKRELYEIHAHIKADRTNWGGEKRGNTFVQNMKGIHDQENPGIANIHLKNGEGHNWYVVNPKRACYDDLHKDSSYKNHVSFSKLIDSLDQHRNPYQLHKSLLKKLNDAYDVAWSKAHPPKEEHAKRVTDLRPKSINEQVPQIIHGVSTVIESGRPSDKLDEFVQRTNRIRDEYREEDRNYIFMDRADIQDRLNDLTCKNNNGRIECSLENVDIVKASVQIKNSNDNKNYKANRKNLNLEIRRAKIKFLVTPNPYNQQNEIRAFLDYE